MKHQILSLADVKCIYKYVRTIHELKYFIEDFHKSQYRYLHISCHGSEESISTTLDEIPFAETMPEPDMSYDCEVKSMTAMSMELVYYMEVGDDYADTMRLVCRRL